MSIVDEFLFKVQTDRATLIEERIRLVLRKKPNWMPLSTYRWFISNLLIIEVETIK